MLLILTALLFAPAPLELDAAIDGARAARFAADVCRLDTGGVDRRAGHGPIYRAGSPAAELAAIFARQRLAAPQFRCGHPRTRGGAAFCTAETTARFGSSGVKLLVRGFRRSPTTPVRVYQLSIRAPEDLLQGTAGCGDE